MGRQQRALGLSGRGQKRLGGSVQSHEKQRRAKGGQRAGPLRPGLLPLPLKSETRGSTWCPGSRCGVAMTSVSSLFLEDSPDLLCVCDSSLLILSL